MQEMDFQNAKLTVLYGSQTGNCQDLAERIWRESKRFYFACSVCSMDDYNIIDLTLETCVIFICSTTGQGEEPGNMKRFWKFLLKKSLAYDSLINTKFAVLGLGDSSYVKFNFVAKRLYKRLLQLGGQSLIPLGLGDDQHELGYDAAADPWIDSLWDSLLKEYSLPSYVRPLEKNQVVLARWKVSTLLKPQNVNQSSSIYYSTRASNEFFMTVKENRRMTSEKHFQDARLIKFATDGQLYNPGDILVLRPRNSQSQVDEFYRVLKQNNVHIEPEELFEISSNFPDMPLPDVLKCAVTFQQLCEEYFDLTSIPRRHTFNVLAQLTDSAIEKERCLEFTTAEGQTDLYNYCNRPRRNITEVLEDFRHATKNITRDILFELLPPIKPRDFSIASSFKYHTNEVHILVAVVKYRTKLVKERLGLCSNYLADLTTSTDRLSGWIKSGSFKFPKENVPVIMVGPGTGVAPFRNFIYERLAENLASKENLILFFGCRSYEKDHFCKDEEKLHEEGKINLINAFSRDQEYKVYVQHKIVEHADLVWTKLATNEAYILVAGNSKNMPREVREAFVKVCQMSGGLDATQAERFIEKMEKSNHYQTETWS